jgi:hypothetical protein
MSEDKFKLKFNEQNICANAEFIRYNANACGWKCNFIDSLFKGEQFENNCCYRDNQRKCPIRELQEKNNDLQKENMRLNRFKEVVLIVDKEVIEWKQQNLDSTEVLNDIDITLTMLPED